MFRPLVLAIPRIAGPLASTSRRHDAIASASGDDTRGRRIGPDTAWEAKVKNLLKAELKWKGVTYSQLVEKLAAIGVVDSEPNIRNREDIDRAVRVLRRQKLNWVDANLFPRDPLVRRVSAEHGDPPPEGPQTIYFYGLVRYLTAFGKRPRFTVIVEQILDTRRDDGKIDFANLPFGENLRLTAPLDFVGYAS